VSVEFRETMPTPSEHVLERLGFVDGCLVCAVRAGIKIIGLLIFAASLWGGLELGGAIVAPGSVPSSKEAGALIREVAETFYREATDPSNYVQYRKPSYLADAPRRDAADDFGRMGDKSILLGTTGANNSTIQSAFPVSVPESSAPPPALPTTTTPQPVTVGVVADSPPPSGTTTTPGEYLGTALPPTPSPPPSVG
jgi:hypothetical protein